MKSIDQTESKQKTTPSLNQTWWITDKHVASLQDDNIFRIYCIDMADIGIIHIERFLKNLSQRNKM